MLPYALRLQEIWSSLIFTILQSHTDMLHTITLVDLFLEYQMHSEFQNARGQSNASKPQPIIVSHLRPRYNTTSHQIKEKSKRSSYNQ